MDIIEKAARCMPTFSFLRDAFSIVRILALSFTFEKIGFSESTFLSFQLLSNNAG